MKIKLHEYYNESEIAEIVEHLKSEIGGDSVTEKDGVVTTKTPCELSNSELFEMAASWAKNKADDYHTKPESFLLQTKYANMLQECCDEYFIESLIVNESLYFEKGELPDHVRVVVKPIDAVHLINISRRYGAMVEDEKKADKVSK